MKEKSLGVDIGSTSIKLIELTRDKNGLICSASAVFPVPAGWVNDGEVLEPGPLARLLRECLVRQRIKPTRVACAVSGSRLLIRKVELPPLPPAKLRSALNWELERYVPYKGTTAEYDFVPLEYLPNKTVAFLAAAPKVLISSLIATLTAAGLSIDVLEPGPLALLRWASYSWPAFETESPCLVLDLGASSTQLLITIDGKPKFARTIPMQETINRGDNDSEDHLVNEIRRSVDYFVAQRCDPGNEFHFAACLCAGGLAQRETLLAKLGEKLAVIPRSPTAAGLIPSSSDSLFGLSLGLALGGLT
ncbi:MAG: pilus assembly protein PilM [Firmicutes bacterium]|nr:pilus assembly protein PilM [Bacillota bacterium]